jgi:hypothetical protein
MQSKQNFTDTLKERASNLTESMAERSQALAEYRDDLTHELRKRGRRVKRTLQKQNRKLKNKLQRQFPQQQKRTFWIAAGFAFSLTLAGIIGYQILRRIAYQLIRRRLEQRQEEEDALELPVDLRNEDVANAPPEEEAILELLTSSQNGNVMNTASPDAAFVGITSTKLYYPIETPLDKLPTRGEFPGDTVYFASEQEASKEGFRPAWSY